MQSWALPSCKTSKIQDCCPGCFQQSLGMNPLSLAQTIWLLGSFLKGTGFQGLCGNILFLTDRTMLKPRIASWDILSRPYGTGPWCQIPPRIASWATFSRPYGTEFSWCSSHVDTLAPAVLLFGSGQGFSQPLQLLVAEVGLFKTPRLKSPYLGVAETALKGRTTAAKAFIKRAFTARLKSCPDTKHKVFCSLWTRALHREFFAAC